MLSEPIQPCHCGGEQGYENCCGRFIKALQMPQHPEQLMRSRYSAYVLKNENYLLQSWHKSTRPNAIDLANDSTHWQGLKIISATDNNVHFVTFFTQSILNKEKVYALTEISHFVKENNWQYLDGEKVNTFQLTKNIPCPCLSGKKYKRCCGKT